MDASSRKTDLADGRIVIHPSEPDTDSTIVREKSGVGRYRPIFAGSNRFPESTFFPQWNLPLYVWLSGTQQSNQHYHHTRSAEKTYRRFVVMLVTAGNLAVTSVTDRYTLKPGQLLLIHPDHTIEWKTGDAGYEHHRWVELAGPSLDSVLRGANLTGYTVINARAPHLMSRLFKRINVILDEKKDDYIPELSRCAYEVILELSASIRSSDYPPEIVTILDFMDKSLYAPVNNSFLAAQVNMGVGTFTRLFRRHLGCTPLHYFSRKKIDAARELLLKQSVSIKEIARTLGYDSQFYFSRLFHKATGMTPTEFRSNRHTRPF